MIEVQRYLAKSSNTGNWVYGSPIESVNSKWYMIHGATENAINTPNEVDFIYSEIDPDTLRKCCEPKLKEVLEYVASLNNKTNL